MVPRTCSLISPRGSRAESPPPPTCQLAREREQHGSVPFAARRRICPYVGSASLDLDSAMFPAAGVLGAAILAVAAPEGVWLLLTVLPYQGAWDTVGVGVLLAGGPVVALACLALVGRGHASAD